MLAWPVIPGRQEWSAGRRTRASRPSGELAATETAESRVRNGGSRVALESRRTGCPGWTSVAPAPASAMRTSTESGCPSWSTTSPFETHRPSSYSRRGSTPTPLLCARIPSSASRFRRPASLASSTDRAASTRLISAAWFRARA